ncbi:methylsterol monooxygenase [Acrasis kona]|uniref:Methylsterol monooxygenase n=1 Tax=Acrasis kona TaxID=1008807 RepID=A0AAW2Z062_9EUKA
MSEGLLNNDIFYKFSFVFPILSTISFLVQAVPLTLLVYVNPTWLHNKYIKGRPCDEEIEKQLLWGIYYSLRNHMFLFASIALAFPLLENYLCYVIIWDNDAPWVTVSSMLQFVAVVYLEDYLYYKIHRAFHVYKNLFNFVHALHHSIKRPVALCGHYMTASEFFLIGGTVVLTPLLIGTFTSAFGYPVHYKVLFMWIIFRQWEAAEEHAGFEANFLLAKHFIPGYDGPSFHIFHHLKVIGNYGAVTSIHDKRHETVSKGYEKYLKGLRQQ